MLVKYIINSSNGTFILYIYIYIYIYIYVCVCVCVYIYSYSLNCFRKFKTVKNIKPLHVKLLRFAYHPHPGYAVAKLVEKLSYKPEGRWFYFLRGL
jgi:hypothetical protein